MTENLLKVSQSAKVDHFIFVPLDQCVMNHALNCRMVFVQTFHLNLITQTQKQLEKCILVGMEQPLIHLFFVFFIRMVSMETFFLVNKLVKLIRNEELITIHGKYGPLLNPVEC